MILGWRRWVGRPPQVNPRQIERYTPVSLASYRAVSLRFANWLLYLRVPLHGAEDWDELLVEFLSSVDLSYNDFGTLLAAVELSFHGTRIPWPCPEAAT